MGIASPGVPGAPAAEKSHVRFPNPNPNPNPT